MMNHKHHKEQNRTGRNVLALQTATDVQFNSNEASASKRPRRKLLVLLRSIEAVFRDSHRLMIDYKWTYIDQVELHCLYLGYFAKYRTK